MFKPTCTYTKKERKKGAALTLSATSKVKNLYMPLPWVQSKRPWAHPNPSRHPSGPSTLYFPPFDQKHRTTRINTQRIRVNCSHWCNLNATNFENTRVFSLPNPKLSLPLNTPFSCTLALSTLSGSRFSRHSDQTSVRRFWFFLLCVGFGFFFVFLFSWREWFVILQCFCGCHHVREREEFGEEGSV